MSAIAWISIILIIIIGVSLIFFALSEDERVCCASILGVLFLGFGIIIICFSNEEAEPQAIDVYRNRTALQITYQDSIPIDTTVVWKEEFKSQNK